MKARRLFDFSSWRRRAMVVLVAAGLAVGGLVTVMPSPALALCSGNGCNGLDPQGSGCSGTVTLTRFSTTTSDDRYTYQLRRSPACDATWGRFVRDDCSYPSPIHHWLRVQTQLQTPYGWYAHKTQTDDMWGETGNCNGGTAWTPMAPAQVGTRARLCWGTNIGSAAPTRWSCSGWYNGGGP
jgi:hypothetical protein